MSKLAATPLLSVPPSASHRRLQYTPAPRSTGPRRRLVVLTVPPTPFPATRASSSTARTFDACLSPAPSVTTPRRMDTHVGHRLCGPGHPRKAIAPSSRGFESPSSLAATRRVFPTCSLSFVHATQWQSCSIRRSRVHTRTRPAQSSVLAVISRRLLLIGCAALAALALSSCRDVVSPLAPPLVPHARPRGFVGDADWGAQESSASGNYDGMIDSVYGGAAPLTTPTGTFPHATIIVVHTSGTVQQVQGVGYFYNYHWGPAGRADHGASMGLRLTSAVGGAMWWPINTIDSTGTVDTIRVDPGITIYGTRADALPQDPGDATHCGPYGYALCYTWTGAAHLDFTRIHVDLTLAPAVVDSSSSYPVIMAGGSPSDSAYTDSTVVFTAGARTPTIAGKNVDISDVRWRWVPDDSTSSDTLSCNSRSGLTCTRDIYYAGTIYVSAYVNGEQQQQSRRVGQSKRVPRRCKDVPEVGSLFPEISTRLMDSVKNELWKQSNYSPSIPASQRHERGGWIINNGNGTYSFQQLTDPGTPCEVLVTLPPPAGAVALIHTHPWKKGEYSKGTCPNNTSPTYEGKLDGEDLVTLRIALRTTGQHLRGYFMDADGMMVYTYDPINGRRLPRCGY
jgi:hypothetical protein